MNNVKAIQKLNEVEKRLGVKSSWHDEYKDSAYIFIGGLDYEMTEGDVLSVFSQYGEIVNINLVRDKGTGKPKGFCFLAYSDQRSTVLAVDNLNGIKLCGRTIRVDHVKQYRRPKDEKGEEIIEQGCAPKTPTPSPSPSPSPPPVQIKKVKKKKSKKDKKGKKNVQQSDSEGDVEYSRHASLPVLQRDKERSPISRGNKEKSPILRRGREVSPDSRRGRVRSPVSRRGRERSPDSRRGRERSPHSRREAEIASFKKRGDHLFKEGREKDCLFQEGREKSHTFLEGKERERLLNISRKEKETYHRKSPILRRDKERSPYSSSGQDKSLILRRDREGSPVSRRSRERSPGAKRKTEQTVITGKGTLDTADTKGYRRKTARSSRSPRRRYSSDEEDGRTVEKRRESRR